MLRQLGLELVIERVARLLVPAQAVGRQRLGVGERGRQIEAAVGVDRQVLPVPTTASTASIRRRSSASGAPPIFILTTV